MKPSGKAAEEHPGAKQLVSVATRKDSEHDNDGVELLGLIGTIVTGYRTAFSRTSSHIVDLIPR